MPDYIARAIAFATAAHAGQVRKYTGEPYIRHPQAVARMVARAYGTPFVFESARAVAAAWLHDVLEDTEVPPSELEAYFGKEITSLVVWLTDTTTPADGNRAARKAKERERLAQAPRAAKTIKLADICDNVPGIVEHAPGFAHRVYVPEKRLCMPHLINGDAGLYAEADLIIGDAERALGLKP